MRKIVTLLSQKLSSQSRNLLVPWEMLTTFRYRYGGPGQHRHQGQCRRYAWLIGKENKRLPVQSRKLHDGAKTAATLKIKCYHFVLSHTVEIAIATEA